MSTGPPTLSDDDKATLRSELAHRRWALYLVAASEAVVLLIALAQGVPVPVLTVLTVGSIASFLAALRRYRFLVTSAAPYLER